MGQDTETTDATTADDAATESASQRIPSWVPDNPTPEPEAEPEEVDEQPDEETEEEPEIEAADEDEAGEADEDQPEDTDEEDSPEEEKAKGHNFDKGVQKLQQRQAAFEKETFRRLDQVAQALAGLAEQKSQPSESKPSESQADEKTPEPDSDQSEILDSIKSSIEVLRGEIDGDNTDPDEYLTVGQARKRDERISKAFDDVSKAIETLVQRQGKSKSSESDELKAIREQLAQFEAERERQKADAEAQAHVEKYWNKFEAENGFDGQELWAEAQKQAVEENPDDTPDVQFGIAKALFKVSVKEKQSALEAEKESAKKKSDESAKPTPQRTPRPSTKGTQTVKPGASTTRPASRDGKRRKPPSWVPD